MSLWLGSGELKYIKQSLDMRSYNSYKYSLADHWIPSDEKSVISGQDTNQTTKEENESKSYQRVGESSNDSTKGFQRFCGWDLIYDALSTASFGKEGSNISGRKRVNVKGFLVKDTEYSLLDICAQELFVALLHSMKALEVRKLDKISVSESGGNLRLENPVISALAKCFTDNGLGTHSDAISCLIPALRSEIPPYQEKVLSALTPVASNYRRDDEWSSAEVVLTWACQYYHRLNPADTDETSDFMVALRELGELYRWSLAQMQHNVRQEFGARGIEQMASKFGTTNPIVALHSTVAERINGTKVKSQGWMDEFHRAVRNCKRADALYNLCFAGNFIPHNFSKHLSPAAQNGWDEIVYALLELKPNPNDQDDDGRTLVSYCAESGLRQSLRRLIDMNADLDLADKYKMTPLAYAAMNGRENIVRLLIKTGQVGLKGSGDSCERTPLWLATDQDHFGTVAELIDKGANVNMKTYRGRGLLDLAICRGNSGLVKSILERGPRVKYEHPDIKGMMEQHRRGRSQKTGPELSDIPVHPLIRATWRGHTDVMRLLLEDYSTLMPAGDDELRELKELLARGAILQPLRNHSDGFFSTLDLPPLSSAPIADMCHIKFCPPYSEAPRLMIGISGLSLEQGSPLDMHWEASQVSETGFTLIRRRHHYGWEPVDSANVTWIEFGAEEQEFQGKDATTNDDSNGYLLMKQLLVGNFSSSEDFNDDYIDYRSDDYRLQEDISFQNAFKQKPNVVVWLRGLSHVRKKDDGWRVSARPDKITANGFQMNICIHPKYLQDRFCLAWLAHPADSTHIQSGVFCVPVDKLSDHNTIQRREFAKKFERTPRVFLAISELIIDGNEKENFEVKVLYTDVTGFFWSCFNPESITGWDRSGVRGHVQWVAFG